MKTLTAALVFALGLLLHSGAAGAQEMTMEGSGSASVSGGGAAEGGFGVGIEAMLAGPKGPSFVYQAESFHVVGIFAFDSGVDNNVFDFSGGDDDIEVGGRFFYQIHSGEISDFSIGGGLGIDSEDDVAGPGDDELDLFLEGAMKIRAFIVPNVALHATAGLTIEIDDDGADDDDIDFAFLGQPMASFGITYFFF